MRRLLRIVRWAVAAVIAVAVLYLGVVFVQVWKSARTDDARPADAIVVMGAAQFDGRPAATLTKRLDHALELYREGIAPVIVVTGGKQPGDRFTEAEASTAYLTERGVPSSAILRENEGRTSWQSLVGASDILKARGLRSVVLVSDGYHAARIEDIATELGLDAVTSPSSRASLFGVGDWRHVVGETFRVAAGRTVGYGRLDRWRAAVRPGGTAGPRGVGSGAGALATMAVPAGARVRSAGPPSGVV